MKNAGLLIAIIALQFFQTASYAQADSAWYKKAIFYQIYPPSYKDYDGDGIGDIKGIIEKLDYVKSVGVDAIWFTPLFSSPFKDGGYDVSDYYSVDKRYGTNDDLTELINKAHQKRLKVCLDLVIGHTSNENPWSGMKVAILGMGGLGHMAVQLAKAFGAEVTVFTTSPDKTEDAKRFGATKVLINKEDADFTGYTHSFDCILDTIPYKHNMRPFIPVLKRDGTYCRVGVGKVSDDMETGQMSLVMFRNAIAGSNTGGIRETQDMINFCALNHIIPEINKITMNGIDNAWKKVVEKKARYRYVIDVQAV